MNTGLKVYATAGMALVSMCSVAATAAHAQGDLLTVQKPYSIKIGEYFPNSSDVRDAVGNSFLSVGFSYDIVKTPTPSPILLGVYADYTDKSRTDFGFRNELGILGLGAAARFTLAPGTALTGHPYGEIGLGYYSITAKNSVEFSDGSTLDYSATRWRVGGKLVGGYEFPMGFFGELEYDDIAKVNTYDPSGFRANVGFRF